MNVVCKVMARYIFNKNYLEYFRVSDTQTHQIAARKEKQMESLKAALGIVSSEVNEINADGTDGLVNDVKNGSNMDGKHDSKPEHAFLDRDFSRKKQTVEGQKDENIKKSHKKIETREKKYKDDSSDSDTSSNEKRGTKKRGKKYTSSSDESDSDSDSKRKVKAKKMKIPKHRKKGRVEGSDSSYDSDDNNIARKSYKKRQESHNRHTSKDDSDDHDDIRKNKIKEGMKH